MTKGQIFFIDKFDKNKGIQKQLDENPLSIYLHGDAYPDHEGMSHGIVNPLFVAVRLFMEIRGYFDEQYMIARVTQHLANLRDLEACMYRKQCTGIGIVNEMCDRNYTYIVTSSEILYWHRDVMEEIQVKPYLH